MGPKCFGPGENLDSHLFNNQSKEVPAHSLSSLINVSCVSSINPQQVYKVQLWLWNEQTRKIMSKLKEVTLYVINKSFVFVSGFVSLDSLHEEPLKLIAIQ